MRKRTQDKFAIQVKTRLLVAGLSIQELADSIHRPRSTVSTAINGCGKFPRVRRQLKERLAL